MVYLFYTTYINVDFAHHEVFRAKIGKGGINNVDMHFYKICHVVRTNISHFEKSNMHIPHIDKIPPKSAAFGIRF